MKCLLVLFVVVVASQAVPLESPGEYRQVDLSSDGVFIRGLFGRRLYIGREAARQSIQIYVNGDDIPARYFFIADRRVADEGVVKYESDVLEEIFRLYRGPVNTVRFNELLRCLERSVEQGLVDRTILEVVELFERRGGNGGEYWRSSYRYTSPGDGAGYFDWKQGVWPQAARYPAYAGRSAYEGYGDYRTSYGKDNSFYGVRERPGFGYAGDRPYSEYYSGSGYDSARSSALRERLGVGYEARSKY